MNTICLIEKNVIAKLAAQNMDHDKDNFNEVVKEHKNFPSINKMENDAKGNLEVI